MNDPVLGIRRVAMAGIVLLIGLSCAPAPPSPADRPPPAAEGSAPEATPEAATTSVPSDQGSAKPANAAAELADFYAGKTVRIIVGFSAGGGFDLYSRLIAKYLSAYMPGRPSVIVENMPGASSLTSANHVYNVAARDGTVIGNFNGGQVYQQLFGAQGVEFDAQRFNVLGVPTVEHFVCVVRRGAGFKTFADVQAANKPLVLGGTAAGGSPSDVARVLGASLGVDIKLVEGYDGTSKIRLAIEQGEVDGGCWGWESLASTWQEGLQSGEIIPLVQVTREPLPDLKDVPLARDLAKTPEAKLLIDNGLIALAEMYRLYVLPPDVPQARVQMLRKAFIDTLNDAAFQSEARQAKLDVSPREGEKVQQLIADLFATPEGVKQQLKSLLAPSNP